MKEKRRYKRSLNWFTFLILSLILTLGSSLSVYADITDRQSIKIVQASLNHEGFDCGNPDGIAGNKTRAAIEAYQKASNLAVTGTISDELLNSLGLSADILKGVLISDFVSRYNEAVAYCNAISAETGDPSIHQISEAVISQDAILDDKTSVTYLIDDRQISVRGLILSRSDNRYDIPMVYELVSATYALDSSFSDMEQVIDFVGNFVEEHAAESDRMNYSAVVRNNQIYFAVVPA